MQPSSGTHGKANTVLTIIFAAIALFFSPWILGPEAAWRTMVFLGSTGIVLSLLAFTHSLIQRLRSPR